MPVLHFGVITLFPEMFLALTEQGVSARAIRKNQIKINFFNPRDYTQDRYKTIDDRPFGGGPGMVMLYEPLKAAILEAQQVLGEEAKVVYLSPQGKTCVQEVVGALTQESQKYILLCGRYEGIDERVVEKFVDIEISIGDYVLSGGELPAMVLMDAMIRTVPGVLGHADSAKEDSFMQAGLLDCPHYTRPSKIDGLVVPEVLLSGHHEKIAAWRMEASVKRTAKRRPDLIDNALKNKKNPKKIQLLLQEYRSCRKKSVE